MMDFSLEHEDAGVLSEAIQALYKGVEDFRAVLRVTEAGVVMRGTDAANNKFTKVELESDAFDQFQARGSEVYFQVKPLYDMVDDGRKTDPIEVELRYPTWEEYEDDGPVTDDEVEKLERKGLDDPKAIHETGKQGLSRQLDLGELRPETLWEAARPFFDVRRNGESVIGTEGFRNYTSAAQVTEEMNISDRPELDPSSQFTVGAKPLNRVIRACDEVSAFTTLACRDEKLRMYAEGDVDDLLGKPPADENELPGTASDHAALVSNEYLNDFRTSIDKKASTDVTLTFHGDEFPVMWEHRVGGDVGASVEFLVAPRISSADDTLLNDIPDETDGPGLLEESAFYAQTSGGYAKDLIEAFGTFVDEFKLLVTSEGVEMRAVDPANVGIGVFEAGPEYFDVFEERNGFPSDPLGLSLRNLGSLTDLHLKSQDWGFGFNPEVRYAGLEHPYWDARIATIDPDSIRSEPDLPDLELSGEAEVRFGSWDDACRKHGANHQKDGGNGVGFALAGSQVVVFPQQNDGDDTFTEVDARSVQGKALTIASPEYLGKMNYYFPGGSDDYLTVRAGVEYPVVVQSDISSKEGLTATYMIAPRVKGDGDHPIPTSLKNSTFPTDWYTDGERPERNIEAFSGIRRETIEERMRKKRLSEYPIETEVRWLSLSEDWVVTDEDDLAVPDSTIEEVKREVAERIDLDLYSGSETFADVTFTDANSYDLDYRDVMPEVAYRIQGWSQLAKEETELSYSAMEKEMPARYQLRAGIVRDSEADDFRLRVALVTESRPMDELDPVVVKDGLEGFGDAYNELVEYIKEVPDEQKVRDAGGEVDLSLEELSDALNSEVGQVSGMRVDVDPRSVVRDSDFIFQAQGTYAPNPAVRVNTVLVAQQYDEDEGGYPLSANLTWRAKGPYGADRAGGVATIETPKPTNRQELQDAVGALIDRIREISPGYAPLDGSGENWGNTATGSGFPDKAESYFPVPRDVLLNNLREMGLPEEMDDVDGIGPSRAETLRADDEFGEGPRDVLDLAAVAATGTSTSVGQRVMELPKSAESNIKTAMENVWEQVLWPAYVDAMGRGEVQGVPGANITEKGDTAGLSIDLGEEADQSGEDPIFGEDDDTPDPELEELVADPPEQVGEWSLDTVTSEGYAWWLPIQTAPSGADSIDPTAKYVLVVTQPARTTGYSVVLKPITMDDTVFDQSISPVSTLARGVEEGQAIKEALDYMEGTDTYLRPGYETMVDDDGDLIPLQERLDRLPVESVTSLRREIRRSPTPEEVRNVDGIGDNLARTLADANIGTTVDVTAILEYGLGTPAEDHVINDLPSNVKKNLAEVAMTIKSDFIEGDFGETLDRDTGRYNVAVRRTGSDDYGERWEYIGLSTGDPEPTPDMVSEAAEDRFTEFSGEYFREGDVVALQRYEKEPRRGFVKVASSLRPGWGILTDRATDDRGTLLTPAPGDWKPIPPRTLRNVPEGALVDTSFGGKVLEQRDGGTVLGWPGAKAYLHRPQGGDSPAYIYKWDRKEEEIIDASYTDNTHVGTANAYAYQVPPEGDTIIGVVRETDGYPFGSDPYYLSDLPENYVYNPTIRSGADAKELVGRAVYYLRSGEVYEAEVVGPANSGAGVRIEYAADLVDEWYVPASSKSKKNEGALIAAPAEVVSGASTGTDQSSGGDDDTGTDQPEKERVVGLFEDLFNIDYSEALSAVLDSEYPAKLTDVSSIGPARAGTLTEAGIDNTVLATYLVRDPSPPQDLNDVLMDLPASARNSLREMGRKIDMEVLNPLKPSGDDDEDDDEDLDGTVKVLSQNRPFPREAMKQLRELGLVKTEKPDDGEAVEVAYVEESPSDDLLVEYELSTTEGPLEVWESDDGNRAEIYRDIVTFDGEVQPSDPSDTAELLRDRPEWSPVNISDRSPFAEEDDDEDGFEYADVEERPLEGKPDVGDYLYIETQSGNELHGTVTRVEGELVLVRTDADSEPNVLDLDEDALVYSTGEIAPVQSIDTIGPAEQLSVPDPVTDNQYEVPEPDDLGALLAALGLNQLVARNIAQQYPSLDAFRSALRRADSLDDLDGVSESSADDIRDAYGLPRVGGGGDGTGPFPPSEIPRFRNKRMENAYFWAAQLDGWMTDGPNAGLEGSYYVTVIGGRPTLVLDDSYNDSSVKALTDAMREVPFPQPYDVREMGDDYPEEGYRVFIREPTDDRLPSYYVDDWTDWETDDSFEDTARPGAETGTDDTETKGRADESGNNMSTGQPDFPVQGEVVYRRQADGGVPDPDGVNDGVVVLEGVAEDALDPDAVEELLTLVSLTTDYGEAVDGETRANVTFTSPGEFDFDRVETSSNPMPVEQFDREMASRRDRPPAGQPDLVARAGDGTVVEVYANSAWAYPTTMEGIGGGRDPSEAVALGDSPEEVARTIEESENYEILEDNRTDDDEDLPEPERQRSSTPSTQDTSEEPVVEGLTESDLEEELRVVTPGLVPKVNAGDSAFRLTAQPEDGSDVRFNGTVQPQVGNASDVEGLIRAFVDDYNRKVDIQTISPSDLAFQREQSRLPDRLIPSLDESREAARDEQADQSSDEPADEDLAQREPDQAGQSGGSDQQSGGGGGGAVGVDTNGALRVLTGKMDPTELDERQARAILNGIVAGEGGVSQQGGDKRNRAASVIVDTILKQRLPDVVEDARAELAFDQGGNVFAVVIDAQVKESAEDRVAGANIYRQAGAGGSRPVVLSVTVKPRRAAKGPQKWENVFRELDKQTGRNPELHERLDTVSEANVGSITSGRVPLPKLFISSDLLRPVIQAGGTTMFLDAPEFNDKFSNHLQEIDSALFAAQRLYEAQTGAPLQEELEQFAGTFPNPDSIQGIVDAGLEELDDGTFDPVDFFRRYFRAYQRDVPADIFLQNDVEAAKNMDGDVADPSAGTDTTDDTPDTDQSSTGRTQFGSDTSEDTSPDPEPEPTVQSTPDQGATDTPDGDRTEELRMEASMAVSDGSAALQNTEDVAQEVRPERDRVEEVMDVVSENIRLLDETDPQAFTDENLATIRETVEALTEATDALQNAAEDARTPDAPQVQGVPTSPDPEPEPADTTPAPYPGTEPTTTSDDTGTGDTTVSAETGQQYADADLAEILREEGPVQVEVFTVERPFGNVFAIRLPEYPNKVLREGQGMGDVVAVKMMQEVNPDDFAVGEVVGSAVVDGEEVYSVSVGDAVGETQPLSEKEPGEPAVETETTSPDTAEGGLSNVQQATIESLTTGDIDIEDLDIQSLEIGSIPIDTANFPDRDGDGIADIREDIERAMEDR